MQRTSYRILIALASCVLLVAGSVAVSAPDAHAASVSLVQGGITYTADDANIPAGATATGYDGSAGLVVTIPPTVTIAGNSYSVTNIGVGAFVNKGLTGVTIPNTVTTISNNAFRNNQLTVVTIPPSVVTIDNFAFRNNKLASITIPSSVTTIGRYVFAENQLTSVTFASPVSLTSLSDGIFYKNLLPTIMIPNTITSIGFGAFQENRLAAVSIPTSVVSIDQWAFYRQQNTLTSLTFDSPSSLTSIGKEAFKDNNIVSVSIPPSVTTIDVWAFQTNAISSLTFESPTLLTTLSDGVFAYNNIANVTIPNTVTSIGFATFAFNTIANVTIPNTVTSIGNLAFGGNNLPEVTIPASVTSIGTQAFQGNPGLSMVCFAGNAPSVTPGASSTSSFTHPSGPTMYVSPTSSGFTTPTWQDYPTQVVPALGFDAQGGAPTPALQIGFPCDGGTASVSPTPPTRSGYGFTGWFTDSGATIPAVFGSLITADVTLYAGWMQNTHVVTFDTQGGSVIAPVTVNENDPVAQPTDPTRTGYTFTGWFTNTGATIPYVFSTPITAAATLYAGWSLNSYTVTFNRNDGSGVLSSVTVNHGNPAPTPANPMRTGYTFTGWFFDTGETLPYTSSTPITATTTLYAGWSLNSYTVTFNRNDGSGVLSSITVNHGNPAPTPANPMRTGYTFTGWFTNTGATLPHTSSTPITAATTLYAGWQATQTTGGTGNTGSGVSAGGTTRATLSVSGADNYGALSAAVILSLSGILFILFRFRAPRNTRNPAA